MKLKKLFRNIINHKKSKNTENYNASLDGLILELIRLGRFYALGLDVDLAQLENMSENTHQETSLAMLQQSIIEITEDIFKELQLLYSKKSAWNVESPKSLIAICNDLTQGVLNYLRKINDITNNNNRNFHEPLVQSTVYIIGAVSDFILYCPDCTLMDELNNLINVCLQSIDNFLNRLINSFIFLDYSSPNPTRNQDYESGLNPVSRRKSSGVTINLDTDPVTLSTYLIEAQKARRASNDDSNRKGGMMAGIETSLESDGNYKYGEAERIAMQSQRRRSTQAELNAEKLRIVIGELVKKLEGGDAKDQFRWTECSLNSKGAHSENAGGKESTFDEYDISIEQI